MTNTSTALELKCYHCGQLCSDDVLWHHDKSFCCYGCRTVFEILEANDLCEYYTHDKNPGVSLKHVTDDTFDYLDDKSISSRIFSFDSPTFAKVVFYIPAIHCVSCIWLLENLQRIDHGVLRAVVNFSAKSVTIDFNPQSIKLSRIATILKSIGYAPKINLDREKPAKKEVNTSLVLKLAIAGFCFGNVMLFSFPEYLGLDHNDRELMRVFSWLNLVLSVPVFLYSGFGYLRSAFESFRQKQINIDVPIAAGLVALFFRSAYDIISATGPGYLDSFTGLVFFLLIGRWFQDKTYENLAFDRDFRSYFPLAVQKLVDTAWQSVMVYELNTGDQIRIRNMEIIPADARLLDAEAYIDYSFVTGESKPVHVRQGELVFAGGRLIGKPVVLVVEKKTLQSHLTSLWNHEAFRKTEESKYQKIIDKAARRFTWTVLAIAFVTALYWHMHEPNQMWLVITSVLMVACPCALALCAPFTYGSMLRLFGKHKFYLKNSSVIERLAGIDAIVFDKTGTVTHGDKPQVQFVGTLSATERGWIKLLTSYSTHPLSNVITGAIQESAPQVSVYEFTEIPGRGIQATIEGKVIRIGSPAFAGYFDKTADQSSNVYVSIDNMVKGFFSVRISIRENIRSMITRLGRKCVGLLSGDNASDKIQMSELFGPSAQLLFGQGPHDKLHFINDLQEQGSKVMMIGDGLNDAGALKQSDVGIAITDNAGVFTPACDGILHGDNIGMLDEFLNLAKKSVTILKTGFVISFFYNAVALSFAVTGHLTPLVAAILMPISSISVVSFSTIAVNYITEKRLRKLKF